MRRIVRCYRFQHGEVVATYIGQWGDQYWSTREPL